jgi:hypothetical protein
MFGEFEQKNFKNTPGLQQKVIVGIPNLTQIRRKIYEA